MDAVLDKEEDIQAEINVFQKYSLHENIVDCYGLYLKRQENSTEQLWIVMEVRTSVWELYIIVSLNHNIAALCRGFSD